MRHGRITRDIDAERTLIARATGLEVRLCGLRIGLLDLA
jgi:hypothetical protein